MKMNVVNLRNEFAILCDLYNGAHYDEQRAFRKYYNETDDKKAAALEKTYDLYYDRFEMYEDRLHANIQLLRRAFEITIHLKENCYGFITHFTIDLTPHIGDSIETDIQIPLYITKWIESEQERINRKYFQCADYITDEITNGGY